MAEEYASRHMGNRRNYLTPEFFLVIEIVQEVG